MPKADRPGPSRLRVLVVNLSICLVLVSLPELLATALLRHPAPLSGGALRVFRRYYASYDRKIIQFLPDCAVYDPELTYRLRTGSCTVVNREHTVLYETNSLGVRDDESSLEAPTVIVLGDSQAMGWGVGQEETFAELLEHDSGQRVLNLAISSYGTVRELGLLARADTSRLEILVIQYCDNDERENLTFEREGNQLRTMDRPEYEATVERHLADTAYYPGRHFPRLFRIWRQLKAPGPALDAPEQDLKEARAFLNALSESGTPLRRAQIIVFEVNGFARNDPHFIAALEQTVEHLPEDNGLKRLRALDLSAELTASKYFILDDHLTADGHRAVADALLPFLRSTHQPAAPNP